MVDSNMSSVIAKVQKLLSLSKSSNIHEAENAARIASKLIEEYRLSSVDLEVSGQSPEEELIEDDEYIYETGRVIPWKLSLCSTLVSHYGLAWMNEATYATGRKGSRFKLFGRKSDIEVCKYMFMYLSLQCQRLADLEAKGKGHIFVFSYCNGFVAGIREQLRLSREEAKATATSAAIVKIDSRGKEANDFMYDKHNNLRKTSGSSKSRMDYNAYSAGMSKGRTAHLGSSLKSGSSTKMLGK